MSKRISLELIEKGRSENGGWTRRQLAILGVPWPPPEGWISRVLGKKISRGDERKFLGKPSRESKPNKKRGGKKIEQAPFLASFEWRRLRMEAIKLYGRRCMCCGAGPEDGASINVDHIKPRRDFPELALDIANLQILCGACNHGKGNWDRTDWRSEANKRALELQSERLPGSAAQHMRDLRH